MVRSEHDMDDMYHMDSGKIAVNMGPCFFKTSRYASAVGVTDPYWATSRIPEALHLKRQDRGIGENTQIRKNKNRNWPGRDICFTELVQRSPLSHFHHVPPAALVAPSAGELRITGTRKKQVADLIC